jgi:hypothetical protein
MNNFFFLEMKQTIKSDKFKDGSVIRIHHNKINIRKYRQMANEE